MLLQPQKHAKNPQYTIASVECTALPHANATIWYIALLLCSEAPAPSPSICIPLAMCDRDRCINTHHPYSPTTILVAQRIYWFIAYWWCQTTYHTLYIHPHMLWFLGIFLACNHATAYISAVRSDRSNGSFVSSYYNQSLVENICSSHGDWWIIRRYLQFRDQLLHSTHCANYYRISSSIATHVCTPLSQCTHTFASHMWLSARTTLHFYPFTHHHICVKSFCQYCL